MEDILKQLEGALVANLYYVALFTALAIPDIAGATDAADGRSTRTTYAKWYDDNMPPEYQSWLDGAGCYNFRCSMLHQGSAQAQNPAAPIKRLMFAGRGPMYMHRCRMNDGVILDLETFCRDLIAATRTWQARVGSTSLYQHNSAKFVAVHPTGIAQYIQGVPVIG